MNKPDRLLEALRAVFAESIITMRDVTPKRAKRKPAQLVKLEKEER